MKVTDRRGFIHMSCMLLIMAVIVGFKGDSSAPYYILKSSISTLVGWGVGVLALYMCIRIRERRNRRKAEKLK